MSILFFEPNRYYNTLGQHEPALRIHDGDTVITATIDAHGNDKHGSNVALRPNPMTGPFYIEEAEPGDVLMVHFDKIFPNRNTGWASNMVAPNVVDPSFAAELPPKEIMHWDLDLPGGTAKLSNPNMVLSYLTLTLSPFMGCFGVSPAGGQAISTASSGEHGGNMDYRGFRTGTIAYLPVFVQGALFFLGDGHAVQGDGEIVGNGIETSFDVQFTIRILKGKTINWPRGEDDQYIFTVGNARPLEQAVQHATTEMLRWLREDYGLDYNSASSLLGQCVEYDVGNIFNPAYTMVCKLKKSFLPVAL